MADVNTRIERILPDLVAWRHDLHAHPEIAFEEHRTSAFVADKLKAFGLEVHTGLAGTGVVGVLRCGDGGTVGLRVDIDALPIAEARDYLTPRPIRGGCTPAATMDIRRCCLARHACSRITVRRAAPSSSFSSRPKRMRAARVMIEEGLFSRFPVDAVFGMHNWPGLPCGHIAVHAGPVMAAFDAFEAVIEGKGSHGAMPHQGIDPITVGSHLQAAWQTIVSRSIDSTDPAVISVTQIHAGDTWNVIPDKLVLRGTVRSFQPHVHDLLEAKMAQRAEMICAAFDATCKFTYTRRYPATINSLAEAETARPAALSSADDGNVFTDRPPSMGAEDFAFMLEHKPGAYVWIGNGSDEEGRNLRSPRHDFNDAVLPHGVRYWVRLAETATSRLKTVAEPVGATI